jgi:hypothetical protein
VNSSVQILFNMYGRFVNVNNYNSFKIVVINFFIFNTICESIRIVHLNSITVNVQIKYYFFDFYVQIKYILKCSLLLNDSFLIFSVQTSKYLKPTYIYNFTNRKKLKENDDSSYERHSDKIFIKKKKKIKRET